MNEQIKKIMEDSGLHIAYENKAVTEKELEFFAEAIVQECIGLRKEIELVGLHSDDYEQGVWEGLQMYQNAIEKHFGIQ